MIGALTPTGWLLGLAIVAGIVFAVVVLLFWLDHVFRHAPLLDEPCRIHPDRWGLYCSTHAERVTHWHTCPGRR